MTDAGTRSAPRDRAELERARRRSRRTTRSHADLRRDGERPPMPWKTNRRPVTSAASRERVTAPARRRRRCSCSPWRAARSCVGERPTEKAGSHSSTCPPTTTGSSQRGETLGTADVITGRLTTLGQGAPGATRYPHQPRHRAEPDADTVTYPTPSDAREALGRASSAAERSSRRPWFPRIVVRTERYPTLCPGETSTAVVASRTADRSAGCRTMVRSRTSDRVRNLDRTGQHRSAAMAARIAGDGMARATPGSRRRPRAAASPGTRC